MSKDVTVLDPENNYALCCPCGKLLCNSSQAAEKPEEPSFLSDLDTLHQQGVKSGEVKDKGGDTDEKKEVKDYKYYLRMWANEKEPKEETIKDLPRMNQEQFIEFCKTLYNMFSEDPSEQELYHAIATVASLLLRIGEVGKKFSNGGKKAEAVAHAPPISTHPVEGQVVGASSESLLCRALADAQMEPAPLQVSDEETRDDTSASSYSVVSSGSLLCEDIGYDTVLIGGEQRRGSTLDIDWSITFEQVLASMLTEPVLVEYFERKMDIKAKMAACKATRVVERQVSSAFEAELTQHST